MKKRIFIIFIIIHLLSNSLYCLDYGIWNHVFFDSSLSEFTGESLYLFEEGTIKNNKINLLFFVVNGSAYITLNLPEDVFLSYSDKVSLKIQYNEHNFYSKGIPSQVEYNFNLDNNSYYTMNILIKDENFSNIYYSLLNFNQFLLQIRIKDYLIETIVHGLPITVENATENIFSISTKAEDFKTSQKLFELNSNLEVKENELDFFLKNAYDCISIYSRINNFSHIIDYPHIIDDSFNEEWLFYKKIPNINELYSILEMIFHLNLSTELYNYATKNNNSRFLSEFLIPYLQDIYKIDDNLIRAMNVVLWFSESILLEPNDFNIELATTFFTDYELLNQLLLENNVNPYKDFFIDEKKYGETNNSSIITELISSRINEEKDYNRVIYKQNLEEIFLIEEITSKIKDKKILDNLFKGLLTSLFENQITEEEYSVYVSKIIRPNYTANEILYKICNGYGLSNYSRIIKKDMEIHGYTSKSMKKYIDKYLFAIKNIYEHGAKFETFPYIRIGNYFDIWYPYVNEYIEYLSILSGCGLNLKAPDEFGDNFLVKITIYILDNREEKSALKIATAFAPIVKYLLAQDVSIFEKGSEGKSALELIQDYENYYDTLDYGYTFFNPNPKEFEVFKIIKTWAINHPQNYQG